MIHWQPSASIEAIKLRARVLKHIRTFFALRDVLEVDTPTLSCATITDPFIESFEIRYIALTRKTEQQQYYLHTSPEFPMKRLLATGLGSIYQIAKVFRQGELGNSHNPEFTLLEWYRDGFDHHQLMQETDNLLTELVTPYMDLSATQYISYQQAFERRFNLNPHTAGKSELMLCCQQAGLQNVLDEDDDKDRFLDLLFSHTIQPDLGKEQGKREIKVCITFLYDYPASQASLARIQQRDGFGIAERFEVFINGIELGNGFHELNNGKEQRLRFEQDNKVRIQAGKPVVPLDERFLASLPQLPDCSGVAIGIERLLMILLDTTDIRDVISFSFDNA
jgi:lysyl-tRNA synthetase class 2